MYLSDDVFYDDDADDDEEEEDTYLLTYLLTSIYCYLLVLAVVDTVVLFVSAFKTWIRLISGVEWLHGSVVTCRGLMFTLLVALHLSAWLIVIVSADRFVAVWMPLKALTLCTPRRARLLCVAVTGVIVVANVHVFWTIHLTQD